MPRNLTTHEALQMAVGGIGEQTLAMLDVVDLNGDVRRLKVSDEEKNVLFLVGLDAIVKERTKKFFGEYYVTIIELMDQVGRRPGAMRQVAHGFKKLAVFLGPQGDDELVYYDHNHSMVAKFRIDPDGEYLLDSSTSIKDVIECLKEIETYLLGIIKIETSPK